MADAILNYACFAAIPVGFVLAALVLAAVVGSDDAANPDEPMRDGTRVDWQNGDADRD